VGASHGGELLHTASVPRAVQSELAATLETTTITTGLLKQRESGRLRPTPGTTRPTPRCRPDRMWPGEGPVTSGGGGFTSAIPSRACLSERRAVTKNYSSGEEEEEEGEEDEGEGDELGVDRGSLTQRPFVSPMASHRRAHPSALLVGNSWCDRVCDDGRSGDTRTRPARKDEGLEPKKGEKRRRDGDRRSDDGATAPSCQGTESDVNEGERGQRPRVQLTPQPNAFLLQPAAPPPQSIEAHRLTLTGAGKGYEDGMQLLVRLDGD